MEAEFPESVETCIDQWNSRPPQSVIYACVVSAYISLAFLPLVNAQPTLPLHFSFNHPSPSFLPSLPRRWGSVQRSHRARRVRYRWRHLVVMATASAGTWPRLRQQGGAANADEDGVRVSRSGLWESSSAAL